MTPPLSSYAKAFLAEVGYHEATYRRNLLMAFCAFTRAETPAQITEEACAEWVADVRATRSHRSAAAHLATVGRFLHYLRRQGHPNPVLPTRSIADRDYPHEQEHPEFAGVVERHLADLRRRGRRPSTGYQRRRVLIRLALSADEWDLFAITPTHLEDFLDRGLSTESLATELVHLHQFYGWAMRSGLTATDPTAPFGRPRIPRRLPRPIDDESLSMALNSAPERIRPWLYLAAYAGLRACEIAQLRVESIQLHADPPLLIIDESKGGGMSSIPLAPLLADAIRTFDLPARGWAFPRRDGEAGPIKAHNVSQLCNAYLRSQGIDDTLHSLRHWFGTNAYRASGRDLRVTQELLRHATPISTAIYTYVDPSDAAKAVAGLPTLATEEAP